MMMWSRSFDNPVVCHREPDAYPPDATHSGVIPAMRSATSQVGMRTGHYKDAGRRARGIRGGQVGRGFDIHPSPAGDAVLVADGQRRVDASPGRRCACSMLWSKSWSNPVGSIEKRSGASDSTACKRRFVRSSHAVHRGRDALPTRDRFGLKMRLDQPSGTVS
jgi:hypothetical protein